MRTIFFEVQDWEEELLKKNFPDAQFSPDKLTLDNITQYKDAQIISCFIYSKITRDIINILPNLKLVATRSTGFDHIDVDYCKSKNIQVANVPEYGTATVAEHTFALILSLTRKIYQAINQAKRLNFNHKELRGIDLKSRTLGIIGLGKIGLHVLQIASGFGMNVLVFNRSQDPQLAIKYDFHYSDLENLLASSDIITLHLPLNNETKDIINRENILKFKKGSYLINTARGGLIDTEAIVLGLEKGILSGVGLDVLEEEDELNEEAAILTSEYNRAVDLKTLVLNHMLINHPKVIITPHNAFNSEEALLRITQTTISNIKDFVSGIIT